MNNFWEKAIQGIEEKYINEALELHVRKMPAEFIPAPVEIETCITPKKNIWAGTALKIAAAFALVLGVGAVLKANNIWISDTGAGANNCDSMPQPFNYPENTGGDENEMFYLPCTRIVNNIPGDLLDLRPSDEVNSWINSFDEKDGGYDSIDDYPNIYSFITYFDVSNAEMVEALSYYLTTDNEQLRITADEFELLATRDKLYITEAFASEYSIYKSGRIYTPEWLYEHTAEDYKKAGITSQDIINRKDLYDDFSFTQDAASAFSAKLSDFAGVEIPIEYWADNPVAPTENDAVDVTDDAVEDTDDIYEYEQAEDDAEITTAIDDETATDIPAPHSVFALSLLGNSYARDDMLYIDDSTWEVSDEYELFRKFFFGVWSDGAEIFAIDDSARSITAFGGFKDFYTIGDNVLVYIGSGVSGYADGCVYWMNVDNAETIYIADGTPGDSPNGFVCEENGIPRVRKAEKISGTVFEPEDGYLSEIRIREMAEEYNIEYDMFVNFEFEAENGTQYHNTDDFNFNLYLVSETEDRIEIRTTTGNEDALYYSDRLTDVSVVFEKSNGEWARTVTKLDVICPAAEEQQSEEQFIGSLCFDTADDLNMDAEID